MPLYEYQCESCSQRFERIQKYSDPPIDACPSCGGAVKKLPSSPAIQFKGTGFYITDYAKKSSDSNAGTNKSTPPSSSDTTASPSTPSTSTTDTTTKKKSEAG